MARFCGESVAFWAQSAAREGLVTADADGTPLPFGEFNVLYNDGQMRIVKTQQGYWGVNERFPFRTARAGAELEQIPMPDELPADGVARETTGHRPRLLDPFANVFPC